MNGFHKGCNFVNVNMLAGESPVRLRMQIRLRGSLSFRFHTWLGFLPADELMLFLSFSFKNHKFNASLFYRRFLIILQLPETPWFL